MKFTCTCALSTISNTLTYDETYEVGNVNSLVGITPFTFSDSSCATTITYSLTQTSGNLTLVANTDYSFDSLTMKFTVFQTYNQSYLGNYTFNLEGSVVMQGATKTANATITV